MEFRDMEWAINGRIFKISQMQEYIFTQVAAGDPLNEICDRPGMPSMEMVYSWEDNYPEFARDMARATEIRGHRLGEEAIKIARETDRVNVNADKLRVETLSKAAARMNARFQDKQVIEKPDELAQMTMEQLQARISRMIQANPHLASVISGLPTLGHQGGQESPEPLTVLPESSECLPSVQTHSAAVPEPTDEHPLEESEIDP